MLQPGDEVGNYTIEALIGEGGFATVYRARHTVLTSAHALKVLRPDLVRHKGLRLRFLNEARIMACLRHPHIVRATDTISQQGIAGIVMDFIEGGSLGAWMDQAGGPPGPEFVRQVFLPILDALHHAHLSGIVHRDIKPANVLLEHLATGRIRPLLTDFGVARMRGEIRRAGEGQTAVGTKMGTLGYMSPEQIRSATEVDARSDVFSVAVTMYEMATLQRLFDGDSEYAIMEAIIMGRINFSAELQQRDPRLAAALQRALSTEPQDRFADCAAFADAIRETLPSPAPTPARQPARIPGPEPEPEPEPEPVRIPGPPPLVPPIEDRLDDEDDDDDGDADVVVRRRPLKSTVPIPGVLGRRLSSRGQATAELLYRPGTPEERRIPIEGDRLMIGKAAGNDIRLPRDSWVARYHCRLEHKDEGWVLQDNTTVHGTMVNGDLVLSQVLRGGEVITVGRTAFQFVLSQKH